MTKATHAFLLELFTGILTLGFRKSELNFSLNILNIYSELVIAQNSEEVRVDENLTYEGVLDSLLCNNLHLTW